MSNIDFNKEINNAFEIGMIQNKKEVFDFINFIKDKNIKNIMEIGTDKGGLFYLLCKISDKNGIKISLDYPKHNFCSYDFSEEERNRRIKGWSDNVFIINGDSHDENKLFETKNILKNEKLDLLFIDGDHSYNGVKLDYDMYRDLVKDGGYIAFHDINGTDGNRANSGYVSAFWENLISDKIEFKANSYDCGIGVIVNKTSNYYHNIDKYYCYCFDVTSSVENEQIFFHIKLLYKQYENNYYYHIKDKKTNEILYSTFFNTTFGQIYFVSYPYDAFNGHELILEIRDNYDNMVFKKTFVKNSNLNLIIENNNIDNDIFIVGCYIETDEQKKMLKDCLEQIKKTKSSPILLVSHKYVPEDIINLVDYYIYDKENPLLYAKDYNKYGYLTNILFFENADFRIEKTHPFRHDYAVWTSMRNAFNFAKYLGKNRVYYLEYDCIINPEEFMKEFILPLNHNDACVIQDAFVGHTEKEHLYFNIFSVKTDIFLNIINQFKSQDDYYKKLMKFDKSKTGIVEGLFYGLLSEQTQDIYYSPYLEKNGGIDQMGIENPNLFFIGNDTFLIYVGRDDNNDVYVAIISTKQGVIQDATIDYRRFFISLKRQVHTCLISCSYVNISCVKICNIDSLKQIDNTEYIDIFVNDMPVKKYSINEFIEESNNCRVFIKNK